MAKKTPKKAGKPRALRDRKTAGFTGLLRSNQDYREAIRTRKNGAGRAAKKQYSPHVPLDIEGERERAQKLVQKVEERMGGRRGKGVGKVMLGPLPKTEARPEPQWAEESMPQPQAAPAPIVGMVRVEEGKAQFPPVAEAGAPRVKGPVLRNSFLFAVFGGGLVGLLMHLAKLDSGFIASAALLLSLLVFAISYFYLNYSSR